jgi:simple sugar transport system permease protein
MEFFTLALVPLIAATLRVATPLLFAALGETISERAGVLNLGIEGMMMLGSFVGFAVAASTGSLWLGVVGALMIGMACGAMVGLLTVTFGLNQHVSGLGVTLLTSGLALFFYRVLYSSTTGVQARIEPFQQIDPLSFLGPAGTIFNQYLLTYIAFALVPVAWWLLYRTQFGLRVRAVGENPEAADTAGINVFRVRYIALMIGGALMGMAGAFLSLAQLGAFTFGIVAGRGWIAIALVIFGNWQPIKVFLGALLFGLLQATQLRLQAEGITLVPYEVLLALPYLITIAALAFAGRATTAPAALLKAYRRE